MFALDGGAIANIAIGGIISAAISIIVSNHYFKKESRSEKISNQVKLGLQKALFPALYPQFFNPETSQIVRPIEPAPRDKDVPFVEYALINHKSIRPGTKVEILIKLRDDGFDLDNPRGVSVRDHHQNSLEVSPLGLGFMRIVLRTPKSDLAGDYHLSVFLKDEGVNNNLVPNTNIQTLVFKFDDGGQI